MYIEMRFQDNKLFYSFATLEMADQGNISASLNNYCFLFGSR